MSNILLLIIEHTNVQYMHISLICRSQKSKSGWITMLIKYDYIYFIAFWLTFSSIQFIVYFQYLFRLCLKRLSTKNEILGRKLTIFFRDVYVEFIRECILYRFTNYVNMIFKTRTADIIMYTIPCRNNYQQQSANIPIGKIYSYMCIHLSVVLSIFQM